MKHHTIKKVKEKQKEAQYYAREKIKKCAKILKQELHNDLNPELLAYSATYDHNIFQSVFDAKCFIKLYKDKIIDYASN